MSISVPLLAPNQKAMEGLGGEQLLHERRGDEEGEEARVHFFDLATPPLITLHGPFRTLQLGSHIPPIAPHDQKGAQRAAGLNSIWFS